MITAKHTPGAWDFTEKLSSSENHHGFHLFAPKHGKIGRYLGEISPLNDLDGNATSEAWANAHLIAAAPELLEALEQFVAYHIDQVSPNRFGCNECRQIAKTRQDIPHREFCRTGKAEAAILKAKGKL